MNNAEERISDVEDRIMEITQSGQKTDNQIKKHKSNIRDLWDNTYRANLCIIGIPEREYKEDWKYIWRNYVWKLSKSKGNISRYRKQRELQTSWTQTGLHQDIL